MAKAKKRTLDKTQVIVAVIAATAAIVAAYWQFVWKPSHSTPPISESREIEYVGRVLDDETGNPIHSAKVTFDSSGSPPVVYTDAEGVYRFTLNLERDTLAGRVRVEADGYEKYDRNITLSAVTPNIEDIRLVPR